MQRWILWAILGVLGLMIFGGGGIYGFREYFQGKPAPVWVPIPLNTETSTEDREDIAVKVHDALLTGSFLEAVVSDLGLVRRFGVGNKDAAVEELKRRLFVKVGTMNTEVGEMPSLNIGMNGTRGEKELSSEMAERVVKDVFLMIGIDPASE